MRDKFERECFVQTNEQGKMELIYGPDEDLPRIRKTKEQIETLRSCGGSYHERIEGAYGKRCKVTVEVLED